MSPSPIDVAAAPSISVRASGWPARALRQLRRVTRRDGVHTLFVHAGGVNAWAPAAQAKGTEAQAHTTVGDWCAAHPGQAANVVASGHLLFSLHIDAGLPLADAAALRSYAQQQFGHYHGTAAQAWPLAVWPESRQRVACALHGIDLPALRAQAEAHDVHLRCMLPAWAVALEAARQQAPAVMGGRSAVVLIEATLVTWMALQGGALVGLRERFLDTPTTASLTALLAELNAEFGPVGLLDHQPVVLGYGLNDAPAVRIDATVLPFQTLGLLADAVPARHWVVAAAGARQ